MILTFGTAVAEVVLWLLLFWPDRICSSPGLGGGGASPDRPGTRLDHALVAAIGTLVLRSGRTASAWSRGPGASNAVALATGRAYQYGMTSSPSSTPTTTRLSFLMFSE